MGFDSGEVTESRGERRPATKDLDQIIDALRTAEMEFLYQVERLEDQVKPDTDGEKEFLRELRDGYVIAAKYSGVLRRYQEGRVSRRSGGDDQQPESAGAATVAHIDEG